MIRGTYDITLHLAGIHISHILKQWLRRPYRLLSAKIRDENIGQNGLFRRNLHDTHVVWDQLNTEGPEGPAFCSRGRTTIGSC